MSFNPVRQPLQARQDRGAGADNLAKAREVRMANIEVKVAPAKAVKRGRPAKAGKALVEAAERRRLHRW